MTQKNDMIKLLAKDLHKEYPRSPREVLGGYVIAARMLDKCRASIISKNGEYHYNCPLDRRFFDFTGIDAAKFKEFVATGVPDEDVAAWIRSHAKKREKAAIVVWNNQQRDMRLSDLPPATQEYMEAYVQTFCPKNRPVYRYFDVFDLEEERI